MVGKDLANEEITTSIEEIIRLNAAAVGVSIFIGSDYERQTLLNLAKMVNDCESYGIPVMAVTAVGKEMEKRDARYLALCCRIAAELGARAVKTYWCENFEKVIGEFHAKDIGAVPFRLSSPAGQNVRLKAKFLNLSTTACKKGLSASIWEGMSGRILIRQLWLKLCGRLSIKRPVLKKPKKYLKVVSR